MPTICRYYKRSIIVSSVIRFHAAPVVALACFFFADTHKRVEFTSVTSCFNSCRTFLPWCIFKHASEIYAFLFTLLYTCLAETTKLYPPSLDFSPSSQLSGTDVYAPRKAPPNHTGARQVAQVAVATQGATQVPWGHAAPFGGASLYRC